MTEHLVTSKRDRRKNIRILQGRLANCDRSGDIKKNNNAAAEAAKSFEDYDEAYAIRWALHYVARHVNLKTGELTISLEPEEAA